MTSAHLSPRLSAAYARLIAERFGMRLLDSQLVEMDKLVMELLPDTPFTDPSDLLSSLDAGSLPDVLKLLGGRLSIGETHFFRVMPQIEALRRTVLPELIARHAADRRLRIWSAGCSSGEEAYTLAMLILEQLPSPSDWDIQLVGSDLDEAALEVARQGLYAEWSFRDTPGYLRTRYFSPSAKGWQLSDSLRRMVRFTRLNLVEDPGPFLSTGEDTDLIVCRFVTIYFGEQVTDRLYQQFAAALRPAGWLMLGPSDPAPAAGFEVVVLDGALVWRPRLAIVHPLSRQPLPSIVPPSRQPLQSVAPPGPRAAATRRPEAVHTTRVSTDAQEHLQAGMLLLDRGAPEPAIDSLRRAAFLDENSPLIQFALGRAYRLHGDRSRSRSAFARARRLLADPNHNQVLVGSEAAAGELRFAVDAQLADLDKSER